MGKDGIAPEILERIKVFQKTEITEYHVYKKLSQWMKGKNREVLEKIAQDEKRHAGIWRRYTGENMAPDRLMLYWYLLLAFVFGVTFAIKIMERNEGSAGVAYGAVADALPVATEIMHDEEEHEKALIDLLDEERLKYIGSMVLGLNDALVELTGALAGFTFALTDGRVVGVAGLITGVAATLSMGASEFLSQRTDSGDLNPLKAAVYTGIAYLVTVALLVAPFFIVGNVYAALAWSLFNALMVILLFSFFVSVVKETPFRPAFLEMAAISLGVAAISFLIGLVARHFIPVDI